jgi:tRNA pseudouridine38-40 synthase
LIGTHDFSAFGTSSQAGGNTIRCVLQADWKHETPYLVFEVSAHAFLYHMVRHLVFMQVMVAQGKLPVDEMQKTLNREPEMDEVPGPEFKPYDRMVHGLAPAQGLILAEVHYPPETFFLNEDKEKIKNLLTEI